MKLTRKINVVGKYSYAFVIPKKFLKELNIKRDSLLLCKLSKDRKKLIIEKVK
jgi:bifunctional DNA-binding transcriptional regulator/antitoxin component of YhaV-PrlF toxin-antitoxin module